MYNIPCNKDLLQASSIPLATVITPFAETGPSEVSATVIMNFNPEHSKTVKEQLL